MRHGKKIMHLGRKTAHRKSMLANMACSLIEHKRINTTVTKAKALKQFVEPIITKSKEDSTHNRRLVFRELRNKYAVSELFRDISQKVGDRPGGYTRIIKLGNRLGDNAEMAMIELVDFNETFTKDQKEKKKTRRRGGKKSSAATSKEPIDNITEAAEEEKVKGSTKEKNSEKEKKSSPKGKVTKTSEKKEKSEDQDSDDEK
mgnify:FL=1